MTPDILRQLRQHRMNRAAPKIAALRASCSPNRDTRLLSQITTEVHPDDILTLLFELHSEDTISDEELATVFLATYQSVNDPLLKCADVLALLRAAVRSSQGPLIFEGQVLPATPITLYRGTTPDGVRGISWTRSKATAQSFADMCAGHVYMITAESIHILGIPPNNGELEVLLDPDVIPDPSFAS